MPTKQLSEAGKDQIALALLLLKDWKCKGRFDLEATKMVLELAAHLGVSENFSKVMMLPRFHIFTDDEFKTLSKINQHL